VQTQRHVTGEVRLRLFKGTCSVVGRRSPYGLYDGKLAGQADQEWFDVRWASALTALVALPAAWRPCASRARRRAAAGGRRRKGIADCGLRECGLAEGGPVVRPRESDVNPPVAFNPQSAIRNPQSKESTFTSRSRPAKMRHAKRQRRLRERRGRDSRTNGKAS